MQEKSSVSLKSLSQIGIGGLAERVYYPENLQEFANLLQVMSQPIIVGGGTNILFSDDNYRQVIATKLLNKLESNNDGTIWAECGCPLATLFSFAAGVPATVGGSVLMNFGAFGHEIKDYLLKVEVFDLQAGTKIINRQELTFGYRQSSLKQLGNIILRVLFNEDYQEHQKEWLQKRKETMPWGKPSLGSVFKNPKEGSAGYFIEKAGLKGYSVGDAQVSMKHANVFINTGKATANDFLQLMTDIKQKVKVKYNIELETEIEYKQEHK